MSNVHIDVAVSTEDLLRAVEKLPIEELDHFSQRVLEVRARRHAHVLPEGEAELLSAINTPLPPTPAARQQELLRAQSAGSLTEEQCAELDRLTDQIELFQAQRLERLMKLAALRGISLRALLRQLGIKQQYGAPHCIRNSPSILSGQPSRR